MNVLARILVALAGLVSGADLVAPHVAAPQETAAESARPANPASPAGVDDPAILEGIQLAEAHLRDLAETRRVTATAIAELSEQLGEMALLEGQWRAHLAELRELA